MRFPLSSVIIAKPKPEDIPLIVKIEQESGLSSWGITGYEREISDPQSVMLGAYYKDYEEGRELVGYFSGHILADEFELLSIAIQSSFRLQGIGSMLLAAGLQVLRAKGINTCWLEVRASNLPALKFYEKFNFRTVGRRRNYYQAPVEDALLLKRECEF